MKREEAEDVLNAFIASWWDSELDYGALRDRILDAMTATTIEQNVGAVEAGAWLTMERSEYREKGCPECGVREPYRAFSGDGVLLIGCICGADIRLVDHAPGGG